MRDCPVDLDIGLFMTEVERARLAILNGRVFDGVGHLLRLRRAGHRVDVSLVEDILDLGSLRQYLYDQSSIGDARLAVRCLAALRELDLDVEPRKINYIRYKKMCLMGLDAESYLARSRPVFRKLLETLQLYFIQLGDHRECFPQRTAGRTVFEEDVICRFPNGATRDCFLRLAFQRAVEAGLSFHWDNHSTVPGRDLTGRLSWALSQDADSLGTDWFRVVKARFDRFLETLLRSLEEEPLPRFRPLPRDARDLTWVVFSRDASVLSRLTGAIRSRQPVPLSDLRILSRLMEDEDPATGAFILHVSISDFDVLQTVIGHKLLSNQSGAPFIVLADRQFFRVMKDHSLLFPGCEFATELNPGNVRRLEEIVTKVMGFRRRFVRLPVGIDCQVRFRDETAHTRARPLSVGGTFIRTHRIVPVFSETQVSLHDRESGFEAQVAGRVVYNARGGSAVRFENIIPFEPFRALREASLKRHDRIVDTLRRARL